ncbi:citramalate synthase [bacterium]|jgi:2-isopropylmalate synthase|nr:citramalate synthase [bacterium]
MKNKVEIYDTTLRDGSQAEGITFSVSDKLLMAGKFDDIGIAYIEGGWPGSNPKDMHFFDSLKKIKFKKAKISAFGSTRRAKNKVEKDPNIQALLKARTPVVTIFGKSSILHVKNVLKISKEENLKLIYDSVNYLKKKKKEVFFDAEHFFDGFELDYRYALETILAAERAGADCIVLCDTNGGTLVSRLQNIIKAVKHEIKVPFGIHTHNDAGLATANSLSAVELGAVQVQGTMNGYGERSGNANLCEIIPALKVKMKIDCVSSGQLRHLKEISRFVDELANMRHNNKMPYVGDSAFAHKAGVHVNAVQKDKTSYEHMDPSLVGNKRRILISDLSGQSNVLLKAVEYGLDIKDKSSEAKKILADLKELEKKGYEFEAAEASFDILMKKVLRKHKSFFELEGFTVIDEKRTDKKLISVATIKVNVDGKTERTAAEGDGPVNALDNALRKALTPFYPEIANVRLTDFKVRVLDAKSGTAAKVRVLIESTDGKDIWGTVGVSENIIEASWEALVDSVEYKLFKDEKNKRQ